MLIVSNDEIGITDDCTVHEFIIIHICGKETETKRRVYPIRTG